MAAGPVTAPSLAVVTAYLDAQGTTSWEPGQVAQALEAETVAQARWCRVPQTSPMSSTVTPDFGIWPADLAEALCRRVARNLAMRALPLGLSTKVTEVGAAVTRVGTDPEIRRLEAPYRRVVLG